MTAIWRCANTTQIVTQTIRYSVRKRDAMVTNGSGKGSDACRN